MRLSARYLVLVLLLAGCGKPSLVGEWKGAQTHDGMTGTARLSLREDAQFNLSVNVVATDGPPARSRQITAGTYKVNGTTITMTVRSLEVDGEELPMPRTGATNRVRYSVNGNTLILDLGNKSRLTLHRI